MKKSAAEDEMPEEEDEGGDAGHATKRCMGKRRQRLQLVKKGNCAIPQFANVRKYGLKSKPQLQGDAIVAYWLASCGSPFNMVDRKVTREFLNWAYPEYNVKTAQTYGR